MCFSSADEARGCRWKFLPVKHKSQQQLHVKSCLIITYFISDLWEEEEEEEKEEEEEEPQIGPLI